METIRIKWAAARVNANLTQDDVAKALNVSKNTVVAWEKYKSEPSVSQAKKMEALYNIPLDMIDTVG